MLENTFLFMTIGLLIILTAVFVNYMRERVDNRDYVFHKIWYLVTYASLKSEILIGTGIAALESRFRMKQKECFGKYPFGNLRMNEIHKKELKLREMKEAYGSNEIPKKESFNLKILK